MFNPLIGENISEISRDIFKNINFIIKNYGDLFFEIAKINFISCICTGYGSAGENWPAFLRVCYF